MPRLGGGLSSRSHCSLEHLQGVTIRYASFSAINVDGTARGGLLDAILAENSIESPGGDAILIHDAVRSKLTLKSNKITGLKDKAKLINQSKPEQLSLDSDLR